MTDGSGSECATLHFHYTTEPIREPAVHRWERLIEVVQRIYDKDMHYTYTRWRLYVASRDFVSY